MTSAKARRVNLVTLPTPLEDGGELPSGARLWVKRDDLTGLGAGGNKARKLEYLCGEALEAGADCLVTVGAAQSNHCRMTAAAGARLGLEVHLVQSGERPDSPQGNQLLSRLFGARIHHTGLDDSDWRGLEEARAELTGTLTAGGRRPHSIPIGGSTPTGALGYIHAYDEIIEQCGARGFTPAAIIHTSSSGGTHAGLLAGMLLAQDGSRPAVPITAIAVAKGTALTNDAVAALTRDTLDLAGPGYPLAPMLRDDDVVIDGRFMGPGYAIATEAASLAADWAARRGAWILDPAYTAKGFSGVLGLDAEGRFPRDGNIVFIHTGGLPAVFATH